MAKQKSFAEKMAKSAKAKDESTTYKVIRARVGSNGAVKYETKIVRVGKDDDEKALIGA